MKYNKMFKYIVFSFLITLSYRMRVFADTLNCNSLGNLRTDLQYLFDFCKIVIPLLIIGLSTYDFIKALTQKDEKNMKKAFQNFVKRVICAVVLFLLPTLLELLLDLIGLSSDLCID